MPALKRCTRTSAERRVAYHEAGHAVARYRLLRVGGLRCLWIDGTGARGEREHRPACGRPSLELRLPEALERIQVCLAGAVAERRAVGAVDPGAERADRERARETALRVSFEPETDVLLRWMALRTERLIEFYWSDVEAVARALLERRSLSAREVEAVIRGTGTAGRRPASASGKSRVREGARKTVPRRAGSERAQGESQPESGRR